MTKLKLDLVCQVAVAVWDMDSAIEKIRSIMGIEENSVSQGLSLDMIRFGKLEPQIYKGTQGEYAYRQVNFFMGGMDFELFAPVDTNPGNPVVDFLNEHGPGIHHLNIRLANREEGIKYLKNDLGLVPLLEGHYLKRHFAYFDMRDTLGIIFEVGSRVVGPRAAMSEQEIDALIH